MKVVSLTNPSAIEDAANILQRGGSIVYPTDTVYGLGVNPFDDFAVRRLFRVKKRLQDKPVSLVVKSIAMAKKLAYVDAKKEKILRALWPGAVSVVLYKRDVVSNLISAGSNTVSLRIPENKFCLDLIRMFDSPVTSTSANISGEQAMSDPKAIYDRFKKEVYRPDLIVDGGVLESKQPSTVLDLTKDKPKIMRVGPVALSELKKVLEV